LRFLFQKIYLRMDDKKKLNKNNKIKNCESCMMMWLVE